MLQFWQISRISAMFFLSQPPPHHERLLCVCKDCCELIRTWPACKRLLLFYVLLFRRIFCGLNWSNIWSISKTLIQYHYPSLKSMVVVIVIVHTTSDISSVWPVGCCRDMIFLVWNEIYYLLQLVVPEHIKVGQTKGAHEKGITFPLHSKWILWQMACNPGWIISF